MVFSSVVADRCRYTRSLRDSSRKWNILTPHNEVVLDIPRLLPVFTLLYYLSGYCLHGSRHYRGSHQCRWRGFVWFTYSVCSKYGINVSVVNRGPVMKIMIILSTG